MRGRVSNPPFDLSPKKQEKSALCRMEMKDFTAFWRTVLWLFAVRDFGRAWQAGEETT
jgi:hypothetical protein